MCEYLCRNADLALEICNELIEKRAQTLEEKVESYILRAEIYLLLEKHKVTLYCPFTVPCYSCKQP